MSGIRIGLAQVNYTPALGLPFMGHFRDDYGAKSTHDPLFAKAMVFEDSHDLKFAICALDICMLGRDQAAMMRRYIENECGIPAVNVLLCATHTHGGPSTLKTYTSPACSDNQIKSFLINAAQAVIMANQKLKPVEAQIGFGYEDRISFNRRLLCSDGKTHMNWEELDPGFVKKTLGPIDPQLTNVTFKNGEQILGCLINFALHPAILDYENSGWTADYPGYMAEALKKTSGIEHTLFVNGCCGNINHIDAKDKNSPRRGFVHAQRCGYMLAATVAEAVRNSKSLVLDPIEVLSELVTLNRFKITDQQYQLAKQQLENAGKLYEPADGLLAESMAPLLIDMYDIQNEPDHVEVMTIRLGELAIVALPGEVFCEIGIEIKKKSPAKYTIVIELANDAAGYFPIKEAFEQGGYEVTVGATKYEPGSAERLTNSALTQLQKLFSGR